MSVANIAVSLLMGLSALLGVTYDPAATLGPDWTVTRPFDGDAGVYTLDAVSTAIPKLCQSHPGSWLRLPGVVHGAQVLTGDGHPLTRYGDPSFATTRGFFGAPTLACADLTGITSLRWVVRSPTRYFARLAFAPQIVPERPNDLFWAETVNSAAGGALLLMAVLSALIFGGKVPQRLVVSLVLANVAMADYFIFATAGDFGIRVSMITAHRAGDCGVWVGLLLTFYCLHLQDVIGLRLLWAYAAVVIPALVLVATGATDDVIQLGTTLPFGFTIALLIVAFVRIARRVPLAERKLAPVGQAFGFGAFALTAINDMFVVTGLTEGPMLLPLGVVGSLLFTAIAVNESIIDTYKERDYLRGNLELEVKRKTRDLQTKTAALALAHDKAERLLLNVLPRSIAERLKEDSQPIADGYDSVTVLFADVAGFTPMAERMRPDELVAFLNRLFSEFDQLADSLGLEKIKTIGDAYMVAGGLPERSSDHAVRIVRMGLAMAEVARGIRVPNGGELKLRIGVNTGPAVAGVIGQRKFIYDIWGDAVNIASRMESHGVEGRVQITSATREAISPVFDVEARGAIEVKGKGAVEVFLVIGKDRGSLPVSS